MNKNFQDLILNQVRKENMPVTVFLTSGFQIRGTVKGFDNYVIVLEVEGKHQMIYKHAISTVAPLKYLVLMNSTAVAGEEKEKSE
ncbi:MAG: RNA chaperone Hfq [Clostridiales bacterium]|jgi:host factor-I protein|nr:RNA chaperone Hfq [Clostridiales bacterium]